ncbi:hypothetical protein O6H91_19G083800 [Diphasiastrum complanatum]|uniref:Uncharacterized protein n=1 Tax=Diphasiastrum complanatum TaxID=34168 RepID=A0ACC2AXB8_DIPCM|nr:hypothetical protein O6H91_19G083800 [Diphasiastrum complanatum]
MEGDFNMAENVEDLSQVEVNIASLQTVQSDEEGGESFMLVRAPQYSALWLATEHAIRFTTDEYRCSSTRELLRRILSNTAIIIICVALVHYSKTESPLKPLRALVVWNILERMIIMYYNYCQFVYGDHFRYEEARWQLLRASLPMLLIWMFSFFPRLVMSIWALRFSFDAAAPVLYTLGCVLLSLDVYFVFMNSLFFIWTVADTFYRRPRRGSPRDINSLGSYTFQLLISGNERADVTIPVARSSSASYYTPSDDEDECCICLSTYESGEELRRLSCMHHFHRICVDKWLMIDARCPLCKEPVGLPRVETDQSRVQLGAYTDRAWRLLAIV